MSFLQFDFSFDGENLQAYFKDPLYTIEARSLAEISSCLAAIDEAVEEGYYVAGYLAYEATAYNYPEIPFQLERKFPLLWFGVFREKLEIPAKKRDDFSVSAWEANINREEYKRRFLQVHKKIKSGVTKQVNYTIRMEADFHGDTYSYYRQLAKAQEADYSAYLKFDDFSILCASPELFFHLKDRVITTKPMKGTASRGLSFLEDVENASWLRNSKKNQEENLLSVHLMMEELKGIAESSSIKVSKAFEIEQYPTVFQMTSTVKARLKEGITRADLFKSLFPSSSITGFPKMETMELINKYEDEPRFIYCGTLGYFSPEGQAIFNVPIRTVSIDHETKRATYGVGGAIMEDSTAEEEYDEILAKAKVLTKKSPSFDLLETIGLIDGEYILLKNHLERLEQSASYFNFSFSKEDIIVELKKTGRIHNSGAHMVRLLLEKSGKFSLEVKVLENSFQNKFISLADCPIEVDSPFIYHKTTYREMYDKLLKPGFFDTLLWNKRGEVTEFSRGNLVLEVNGRLLTPPVSSGLLPGTFRKALLKDGKIQERVIMKNDLLTADKIYFINSVRKWIEVNLRQ